MTDDRKSLIDVIYYAITQGDDEGNTLRVYGNATNDDEFRQRYTNEEFIEEFEWNQQRK